MSAIINHLKEVVKNASYQPKIVYAEG